MYYLQYNKNSFFLNQINFWQLCQKREQLRFHHRWLHWLQYNINNIYTQYFYGDKGADKGVSDYHAENTVAAAVQLWKKWRPRSEFDQQGVAKRLDAPLQMQWQPRILVMDYYVSYGIQRCCRSYVVKRLPVVALVYSINVNRLYQRRTMLVDSVSKSTVDRNGFCQSWQNQYARGSSDTVGRARYWQFWRKQHYQVKPISLSQ